MAQLADTVEPEMREEVARLEASLAADAAGRDMRLALVCGRCIEGTVRHLCPNAAHVQLKDVTDGDAPLLYDQMRIAWAEVASVELFPAPRSAS